MASVFVYKVVGDWYLHYKWLSFCSLGFLFLVCVCACVQSSFCCVRCTCIIRLVSYC